MKEELFVGQKLYKLTYNKGMFGESGRWEWEIIRIGKIYPVMIDLKPKWEGTIKRSDIGENYFVSRFEACKAAEKKYAWEFEEDEQNYRHMLKVRGALKRLKNKWLKRLEICGRSKVNHHG